VAGYVDISAPDPWTGWGDQVAKRNALAAASAQLRSGDATGARNALLAAGYPAEAQTVQSMGGFDATQKQAAEAAALTKSTGAQYAAGNAADAIKAALAGGNLDLAKTYRGFQSADDAAAQQATTRAAVKQAAALAQAGDIEGARRALLPHYSSPDALAGALQSSRDDVRKTTGGVALSFRGDPDGWNTTGLQALRMAGIDPAGFEGEAGRARAEAQAGYSLDAFKQDAADARAASRKAAAGASTLEGRVSFLRTAWESEHPGVPVSMSQLQRAAGNYKTTALEPQTDPATGQTVGVAVTVNQAPNGPLGAATRALEAADKYNQAHAAEIEAGTVQPMKPEDTEFGKAYSWASKRDLQGRTVATREFNADPTAVGSAAYARTPTGAGAVTEARTAHKLDADLLGKRLSVVGGAINHSQQLIDELQKPEAEQTLGVIRSSVDYQHLRNLLPWPQDKRVAASWGKIGQELVSLQAEANRVYQTGSVGTDSERGELRRLTAEIAKAPSQEVALSLAMNLRELLAGLLTVPRVSDTLASGPVRDAQREGLSRVERFVGGNGAGGGTAPRVRKYNPATGALE
jgi:hypothetical protein